MKTMLPTDTKILDWLQEQIVDTVYLDDGRIIDIRGRNARKVIAEAMRKDIPHADPGASHDGD